VFLMSEEPLHSINMRNVLLQGWADGDGRLDAAGASLSLLKIVLQKSTPTKIRQLVFY
jgi:hypothetical protein